MRRSIASAMMLVPLGIVLAASTLPASAPAAGASPADVEHGRYLAVDAGQCIDCHGTGFAGAPIRFPGPPGVPWATAAPSLIGLPMFSNDVDAVTFLTTGLGPDGKPALPPMPQYRFNAGDARAIVAYLRSLKT